MNNLETDEFGQMDLDSPKKDASSRAAKFLRLTFLLTIPIWIFAQVTKHLIPEGLPINHLGFLAVFIPATSALILTIRETGLDGAKILLHRAYDWTRITRKIWYLPIVALLPVVYASTLVLLVLIGEPIPALSIPVLPVLVLFPFFILFAIGEEVGWMGYAYDLMETRWNAISIAFLLGLIGAVWHFPLFLIQNPPGGMMWIAGQCVNIVLIRILSVWIYKNTGSSVFALILFHAIYNVCTMVLPVYVSPLGPIIGNIFLFAIVIGVLLHWNSRTLSTDRLEEEEDSELELVIAVRG